MGELKVINIKTGELLSEVELKLNHKEKFFLGFCNFIDTLYNIDKKIPAHVKVLQALVVDMNFENNVSTGKDFRNRVKKKFNLSERTIKDCVYYLEKLEYIKKRAMNEYTVNPFLFGKGSIKHIKRLRMEYYDNNVNITNEREKI